MAVSCKIYWFESALKQLDDICEYNSQFSETFPRKLTRGIEDEIKRLKKHPFIGQQEGLLKDLEKEYRYLVFGNYKIIYRYESQVVYIVSIFDTRSNPDSLIKRIL